MSTHMHEVSGSQQDVDLCDLQTQTQVLRAQLWGCNKHWYTQVSHCFYTAGNCMNHICFTSFPHLGFRLLRIWNGHIGFHAPSRPTLPLISATDGYTTAFKPNRQQSIFHMCTEEIGAGTDYGVTNCGRVGGHFCSHSLECDEVCEAP